MEALLNEEKDMTKEIEWLAEHDKGFNDGYREFFNSKKQLFGLPDDQIVTSRESLGYLLALWNNLIEFWCWKLSEKLSRILKIQVTVDRQNTYLPQL